MSELPKLYALLARDAPVGVIFRRGPVGRVLAILWDTATDQFTVGEWLAERIYVDVSGLSPDGQLMVCFCADNQEPERFWTQVSRTPHFEPLAEWPRAEGWHGGGWFDENGALRVKAAGPEMEAPLPVELIANDAPIPWTGPHPRPLIQMHQEEDGITLRPYIWREQARGWVLETHLSRADNEVGWRFDFSASGPFVADLEGADWAGLDHAGRLIFARCGCLFAAEPQGARMLLDTTGIPDEPTDVPDWAKEWP